MSSSKERPVLKEKQMNSRQAVDKHDSKDKRLNTTVTVTVTPDTSRPKKANGPARESQKKPKTTRPKPVYFWTNADVTKWLRRQCTDYHKLYGALFVENDITGRSLVRMTDVNLQKLGIQDNTHRDELWREILKLRLKTDILEMRDMETKPSHKK